MASFCSHCGSSLPEGANVCPQCGTPVSGAAQPQQTYYNQPNNSVNPPQRSDDAFSAGPSGKSRGVAALLALILGTLGIHYFYLGKNTGGIVFLLVSLVTCGVGAVIIEVLCLITCVRMFSMSTEQFEQDYVNTSKSIPI